MPGPGRTSSPPVRRIPDSAAQFIKRASQGDWPAIRLGHTFGVTGIPVRSGALPWIGLAPKMVTRAPDGNPAYEAMVSDLRDILTSINASHGRSFRLGARFATGESGAYGLVDAHGTRFVLKWHVGADADDRLQHTL